MSRILVIKVITMMDKVVLNLLEVKDQIDFSTHHQWSHLILILLTMILRISRRIKIKITFIIKKTFWYLTIVKLKVLDHKRKIKDKITNRIIVLTSKALWSKTLKLTRKLMSNTTFRKKDKILLKWGLLNWLPFVIG